MKKTEFQIQDFREMTEKENQFYYGGGFAYDAGRVLRFIVLSAPGGIFVLNGICDAIANAA